MLLKWSKYGHIISHGDLQLFNLVITILIENHNIYEEILWLKNQVPIQGKMEVSFRK